MYIDPFEVLNAIQNLTREDAHFDASEVLGDEIDKYYDAIGSSGSRALVQTWIDLLETLHKANELLEDIHSLAEDEWEYLESEELESEELAKR